MQNPVWIGSPVDIREGQRAEETLSIQNDCKYWQEDMGVVEVDERRWQQAQKYETETWMKYGLGTNNDRSREHATLFNNYKVLPEYLGNLLEIGCGPFTQTKIILRGRRAESITLVDPLLDIYKKHPNCNYPNIRPEPTLISMKAEELGYSAAFDTVICINVLEHVQDAARVLGNILRASKQGSMIIMGERTYDELDITKRYDVGHPIRIKSRVLNDFKRNMEVLYSNSKVVKSWHVEDYFIAKIK